MNGKLLPYIVGLLLLSSCHVRESNLKSGFWKHGSGESIGDIVDFNYISMKNDTIFEFYSPKYVISNSNYIPFIGHEEIEIKSLKNGKTGTYFHK